MPDMATRCRRAIRLDGTHNPGHIIASLREQAGLSRPELARRVAARTGQTPGAIRALLCKWEKGKVRTPEGFLFDCVARECGYGLALLPLAPEVANV